MYSAPLLSCQYASPSGTVSTHSLVRVVPLEDCVVPVVSETTLMVESVVTERVVVETVRVEAVEETPVVVVAVRVVSVVVSVRVW